MPGRLWVEGLGCVVTCVFSAAARGDSKFAGDVNAFERAVFEKPQQQQQNEQNEDERMTATDGSTYDL